MWGAIILGGGSGQRMGAKCNKVLLPIAGKSMIVRSVEAFMPLVEQVVVVSREEDMPAMASELAQNGLDVPVVSGGATRQESVWRGLQALSGQCDGVLVHDGARCLVTADVIQRCMASVEECGTGVAAGPVAFFSAAAAFSASRRAFFSANVSDTPACVAGAAEAACAGS